MNYNKYAIYILSSTFIFSSLTFSGKKHKAQSSFQSSKFAKKPEYNPILFHLFNEFNLSFSITSRASQLKITHLQLPNMDEPVNYPKYLETLKEKKLLDLANPEIRQKITEDLEIIYELASKNQIDKDIAIELSNLYYDKFFRQGSPQSKVIFYEIFEQLYKKYPHAPIDYLYEPYLQSLTNHCHFKELDNLILLLCELDKKNPILAEYYIILGMSSLLDNRCIDYLKKSAEIKSSPDILFYTGLHYLVTKKYSEARDKLTLTQTLLSKDPKKSNIDLEMVNVCLTLCRNAIKANTLGLDLHNQLVDQVINYLHTMKANPHLSTTPLVQQSDIQEEIGKSLHKSVIKNLLDNENYNIFCKFFEFYPNNLFSDDAVVTSEEFLKLMTALSQKITPLSESHFQYIFDFRKQGIPGEKKVILITQNRKRLGPNEIKEIRTTFLSFGLYPEHLNELLTQ